MNLYVLRHASAGEKRANPVLDRKRPLDKEGKQQCILVGSYLNALRINVDLIVSSPLKRALQTASLVGTELGYESTIQLSEELAPGGTVEGFRRLIDGLGEHENVLVIGHNPSLSTFLSSLITSSGKANIRLRKGTIARVDCTRKPGLLISLIDPRAIRMLYTSVTKKSRPKTSRK
jgi:phosphohistidine phosphatase